jgi:ankyrin repeat protein
MIKLLLKHGANPRAVNKQGMHPGDYAQTPEAREIRDVALGGINPLIIIVIISVVLLIYVIIIDY